MYVWIVYVLNWVSHVLKQPVVLMKRHANFQKSLNELDSTTKEQYFARGTAGDGFLLYISCSNFWLFLIWL